MTWSRVAGGLDALVHAARRRGLGAALIALPLLLASGLAAAQDAATLRARHAAMRDKLANNPFQRPLVLEATQPSGGLKGDVYSTVDHPYPMVLQALQPLDNWCDILILHLNVKQCQAENGELVLSVGRKFDQPVADAHRLEFKHRLAAATPEYLQVQLSADKGPFSTRDYRIVVEAIPLDAKRTFIHMSYAYAYGLAAKMATQTYLATLGRDKVGFTITERRPDGSPVHVGGVVGLLERNTMRYYLAIDAYLGAFPLAPGEQVERRIQEWYAGTERYARQLHEMDRNEYLEMKRKEIRRMDAAETKR